MKLTAQKTPGQQLEQIAIMESPQWLNGWGGGFHLREVFHWFYRIPADSEHCSGTQRV